MDRLKPPVVSFRQTQGICRQDDGLPEPNLCTCGILVELTPASAMLLMLLLVLGTQERSCWREGIDGWPAPIRAWEVRKYCRNQIFTEEQRAGQSLSFSQ